MMNRLFKRISVILAVVLMVTSVPMDTYAAVVGGSAQNESITADEANGSLEDSKDADNDAVKSESGKLISDKTEDIEASDVSVDETDINEDGLDEEDIEEVSESEPVDESEEMCEESGPAIVFDSKPDSTMGVKTGETVTLTVAASLQNTEETSTITYQWYKNGVEITGATNATYISDALTDKEYTYSCIAKAVLLSGTVSADTGNIKVTVNKLGVVYGTRALEIKSSLSTQTNEAEGWSWDQDTKTLTLDNALLKSIKVTCDATIDVKSDSIVSNKDNLHALYICGDVDNVEIKGTGKLTLYTTDGNRYAFEMATNKSKGSLTISGDELVVECQVESLYSTAKSAAVCIYKGAVNVTEGATLNASSALGKAIVTEAILNVESGAKVYAYTDAASSQYSVELKDGSKTTITGKGSELITDRRPENAQPSIYASGSSEFKLDDHAKVIMQNCAVGIVPMSVSNAKVSLGNGRLEAISASGPFTANSAMLTYKTPEQGESVYLETGLVNTEVVNNKELVLKESTDHWRYVGDKPYIEFAMNPADPTGKLAVKKGDNIVLTVQAEIKESESTPAFSYQWYLDGELVPGATDATSTISSSGLKPGGHTIYCKASMVTAECGPVEEDSYWATVYVTDDGRMPRTNTLDLRDMETSSDEEEGWSWNKDSKTLTLNNFVQYINTPYISFGDGAEGIILPGDSTIILKGDNLIQTYDGVNIWADGNLLIYGSGNITLNCDRSGRDLRVYAAGGVITIHGNITKGEKPNDHEIKHITDEVNNILTARIEGSNDPFLYFNKTPNYREVFTGSIGGAAPTISLSAVLANTEGSTTYKYKWYATDNWSDPTNGAVEVKGATSSTLKAPVSQRGGKYYYCEVTAANNGHEYKLVSEPYCVVVGARGVKPITSSQTIGNADYDKSEYGWSYTKPADGQRGILKLNNVEVFIPFATNGSSYSAFHFNETGEFDVVMEKGSENNIAGCFGGFYIARDGLSSLEIKGKGTINYTNAKAYIGIFYLPTSGVGSIKISEGAIVNELSGQTSFYKENITVSGAEYRLRNGSANIGTITVENGGKLCTNSDKSLKVEGINVDSASEMNVECTNTSAPAIVIDNNSGELVVGGSLLITSRNKDLLSLKCDSDNSTSGRIRITDGAVILSPAGVTVSDLYLNTTTGYDVYGTTDKQLFIAPGNFKRTAITGVTAITGELKTGGTVTAGNVTPAGATISYQWQYAATDKTEDALWKNIPNAVSNTYTINKEYLTGKYLRVKITGTGKYSGTVYSKAASPVKTDGATMVDFIADGHSLGEYSSLKSLSLSYSDGFPDEIPVRVIAEDPSAQIVIKNVTEGFIEKTEAEKTISGSSGMMPVKYKLVGSSNDGWSDNDIKVSITSGGVTKTYDILIHLWAGKSGISIKAEPGMGIYLVMADADSIDINNLDELSVLKIKDDENVPDGKYTAATPGATYTVIAYDARDGWYLSNFGKESSSSSLYEKNAWVDDNEIRWTTFTMPKGKSVEFDLTSANVRVKMPAITGVDWNFGDADGYYFDVDWDGNAGGVDSPNGQDADFSAQLLDENGNEIEHYETYESENENGKGTIYELDAAGQKKSLDPTKSYTLKFCYDIGSNSDIKCDKKVFTIDPIAFNMSNNHIVIKKPADTKSVSSVPVNANAKAYKVEQYPSAEESKVKVEPNGSNVDVTVQTTANAGTVYAMVYQKYPDGSVDSAILTIDVVEPSESVYVGLGETAGTIDIYKDANLIVPVNTANTAASIVSASFVESSKSALSDKYTIEPYNTGIAGATGRAVMIKPIGLPAVSADNTDWANVVKAYKGTFKAKIKIVLQDDPADDNTRKEYITSQFYTLTINGTAPTVKADAVKFNSFYQGDTQKVNLTSKNGEIVAAVVDTFKSKPTAPACPEWVELSENGFKAALNNSKLVNNKGNGKLCLNVAVAGYRIPAQVSPAVSAAYTQPKVKLSESSITVPSDASKYVSGKGITILSADNKVDYSSLNITGVRVADSYDFSRMSANNKKTYSASKCFTVGNFEVASGEFTLDKASEASELIAGKVLLIATVGGNSSQEIEIPLTIKVQAASKATVKMDKTSITLNSYLDNPADNEYGAQKLTVNIVPSISGISVDDAVITVTDARGKVDYNSYLDIAEVANYAGRYTIATNSNTIDGTYKVNFTVPTAAKPATVTVVVKGTVPTVKLSKSSVTFDRYLAKKDGSDWTNVGVTTSDDSILYGGWFKVVVWDSKKNEVSHEISKPPVELLAAVTDPGMGKNKGVSLQLARGTKTGTYYVDVIYTMPSGKQAKATETVKITSKAPTLKADKKTVTLNPDLGKDDKVSIMIDSPDAYDYASDGNVVTVYDSSKNVVSSAVMSKYANGVLELYAGSEAVRGATYKVVLSRKVKAYADSEPGTASTEISVKIPKASSTGKTAITQKITTKGTIEIARPESVMQVNAAYTGWNGDVYLADPNSPKVMWTVYAYDKKGKPYNCGNSEYQYQTEEGLKGLVASSETPSNLNWFVDADSSNYGVALKLNPNNPAVKNLKDTDGFLDLNFKIVYTTVFPGYSGVTYEAVSEAKFKLSMGTVKFTANPATVTLDKNNGLDSKVVKVSITDKDAMGINITGVSMADNSPYDASLLYVGGGYAYVAIGWKDDAVTANVKNGRQVLSLYTGYNYAGRLKANGTANVTVNVQ